MKVENTLAALYRYYRNQSKWRVILFHGMVVGGSISALCFLLVFALLPESAGASKGMAEAALCGYGSGFLYGVMTWHIARSRFLG